MMTSSALVVLDLWGIHLFQGLVGRPPHIILFPLPIILFSNSQNDPLLFLYNSFLCESAHYSFFPAHVGNRGGAKAVQEG